MRYRIIIISCLFAIFSSMQISALDDGNFIPKSPIDGMTPNVASIKRYGDIPVSLYTGTPSISIPLITLQEGSIYLPLELSYHSAVKADERPGWVGLGWSLSTGGVISREIRDLADETLNGGYMVKCKELSLDKANASSVKNFIWYKERMTIDTEPDKFNFSFPGYSGYFMLDSNGNWIVNCDRALKVEAILNEKTTTVIPFPNKQQHFMANSGELIKGFKIIDDEGTAYFFGSSAASTAIQPAIDLTISSRNQACSKFSPSAWHLVEIRRTNGDYIEFDYERGDFIVNFSNRLYRVYDATQKYINLGDIYHGQLISPVYLSKISGASFTAEFSSSMTNDLNYSGNDYVKRNTTDEYINCSGSGTIYSSDLIADAKWRKLNVVKVKNSKGIVTDRFEFNYTDKPSQRLTLNNLVIKCLDDTPVGQYSFAYNNIDMLPGYLSDDTDLWGYSGCRTNNFDLPDYKQSSTRRSGYGLLTQITYPTGGNTILEYEPHTYTRYVDVTGSVCTADSQSVAGGVRIKRIINVPRDGGMPEYKEYLYSDGILEGKPVVHHEMLCVDIKNNFFTLIEESNYSLSSITNNFGNHIAYPKVTERFADGSYIVHEFISPMTLGYRDEPSIYSNYECNYVSHTQKGHYRGKPLSISTYSNEGKLIKTVDYAYEALDNKFNQGMYIEWTKINCLNSKNPPLEMYRMSLYRNYLYSMVETSCIETVYGSESNVMGIKQQYRKYNSEGQLICDSTVTMQNDIAATDVTRYSYLWEKDSWYATRNIKTLLSEILFQHNGKTKSHIVNNYFQMSGKFPVLGSVVEKYDGSDSKTLYSCSLCDDKGLPVRVQDASGLSTIYLWGQDRTHPLAEIKNAEVSDIRRILGYGPADSYKDVYLQDKMSLLRAGLPNAWVTSYNYEPMIGVMNITDPAGKTTYYDYDRQKRLFLVRDLYGNHKIRYVYNTYSGSSTGTDYLNPLLSNTTAP
ncbi:MAG: hypothetical protein K2M94_06355 [Paramuribaculum sp.]|nr:hypothetical protein [Paramuribaculum sp.]